MPDRTVRKLAAIVSTDIVGYSRLMEADEAKTLARMKAHRQELWSPVIDKHGGRVVGTAGDSMLVEYGSAVSAIESAIEVQQGMAAREAEMPDDRKMLLRIGVNIGEIVTALRIKLSDGEQAQLVLKGTESVEAWSYAMPAVVVDGGGNGLFCPTNYVDTGAGE